MLKRVLLALVTVAMISVAFPAVSQADVRNNPIPRFPTFNGQVRAIAHAGNVVYLGGDFTRIHGRNGTFVRRGAAAINGRTGSVLAWNPAVAGEVRDIAVAKEGVYLGGAFKRVKGKPRRNLARVGRAGAAPLHAFRVPVSGFVRSVEISGGRIFLGGSFTKVGNAKRNKLASINRKAPYRVNPWRPTVKGDLFEVEAARGNVYLGGTFSRVNNRPAFKRLAAVRQTGRGALVGTFRPTMPRPVIDLWVTKGRVFVAGGGAGGGAAYSLVRGTGLQRWVRHFDGDVQAIQSFDQRVYVGGHFKNHCATDNQDPETGRCADGEATPRRGGAALTGAGALGTWDPDIRHEVGVRVFDAAAAKLFVGGPFLKAPNATSRRGLAVYN
jgi:hypothetical protein